MSSCGNNCNTAQIFRDFKELLEQRKEDFDIYAELEGPLDRRLMERIDKLLRGNVDKEVVVTLLKEMLLCDASFTYIIALEFVTFVVNEDEPEPENLSELLYTMLLFVEEAHTRTPDLALAINAYLGNRDDWGTWEWKALDLTIELGLNWLTYDEVRTRIPHNFLELPDTEYEIVKVLDKMDRVSDLPCDLDQLSFRSKRFLDMAEEIDQDKEMKEEAAN